MRNANVAAPWLWMAVAVLGACSSNPGAGGGSGGSGGLCSGSCVGVTDCAAGATCVAGQCAKLCSDNSGCSGCQGLICGADGYCSIGDGGPVIDVILGNDSSDSTRVVDGMIVTGQRLAAATLTLTDAGANPIGVTVRSQSDTQVELVFPFDVLSGDYTLVATNAAGSAQATVTLTLPELTGDIILTRLNGATGTIAFARLPVGVSASEVAQGDHTHDASGITSGTLDVARLPVGQGAGQVAAGDHHTHALPPYPAQTPAAALGNCSAIFTADASSPSGLYWIDPNGGATDDAFQAHCEMTTHGGGWTLAMNVHPADGSFVHYRNDAFWRLESEYGSIGQHFTHDYKSPAAWALTGTNIMIQIAKPGAAGPVVGWRAWSMPNKSLDTFFDAADNTVQTTGETGADVANVYAYEPLLANGAELVSNKAINPNVDRVRLSVDAYAAQGDDNQAGLGTWMNAGHVSCAATQMCWRYRDVELWVNNAANRWASQPIEGEYKWIGTDGGCGALCNGADEDSGPGYSPYWTYRIYIKP